VDELTELAVKYGTDKGGPSLHTYTNYYYDLFKDKRNEIKKVLEIGIAEGASLRMWRDFFPNATIYGIDIDPKCLFIEDRIKTYLGDQSKANDLVNVLKEVGSDIDIVIDDGSHVPSHQIYSCQVLMPLLQKQVIYIIEDAFRWHTVSKHLPQYDIENPQLIQNRIIRRDNRMVVIRNK